MVPEGWKESVFGEAFNIKTGIGFKYAEYADEGIPLVKIDNVSHGYIKWENISYLPEDYLVQHADLILKEGDIVVALNRPITQGKLKIARIQAGDFPSILYQRVGKIYPITDKTNQDYFYYGLEPLIFKFVKRKSIGSDQPFISTTELKKIKLLIPPLPEQKKIAQILSTWDKAITTTEQLLANIQQQKKALMQQLLTGKKRLLDDNGVRFSGEWQFLTFDGAFKVVNKKSTQVKSSEYLDTGAVPVVDQGQQLIVGYCNNEERYTSVPVIVFGDHTRCLKWVDFEFCPGADGTQVLDTQKPVDKKFGYYLLCFTDIPNLGYSRHMRELKEKDFKAPKDVKEQQKIAAVLASADQEIDSLQQKIEALKQEKKALMQQLLTGKRRVKTDDKEIA
ncbi:restriction endonuclease subunit S [Thiopseudomonas alkaliphila]|uniref:restriction endonuclease subunit S n=1 Tax=Thiopseudomonas alkaliphila TaxID=1697053 RepID=UPI0025788515|nr:restriction endonuclease subunit S [Thiopseudomonas alkaliphila]MDM1708313.1 restriction endonuclease subunit S [Thiopseudomonas alkaliphila]